MKKLPSQEPVSAFVDRNRRCWSLERDTEVDAFLVATRQLGLPGAAMAKSAAQAESSSLVEGLEGQPDLVAFETQREVIKKIPAFVL